MTEFPPNSHRSKNPQDEPKVERVTTSRATRRRKPIGKRLAETFLGGDARSVTEYVVMDVLIPALKDTVTEMISTGVERLIYGDRSSSHGRRSPTSYGPSSGYVSYNRYTPPRRQEPEPRRDPQRLSPRARTYHELDQIVLASRVEAEDVLDRMFDIIARYDAVSVGDLYELVGEPKSAVDERWGWRDLTGADTTKLRRGDGYILNLPNPERLGNE